MNVMMVILLIAMTAPLSTQWLQYPDPAIPRTNDGRPGLAAPAPRSANGKPNLSGVWAAEPSNERIRQLGVDPTINPLSADLQFISL